MKKVSKTNPLENCANLDKFDFEPWREKTRNSARVEVKDDNEINSRIMKN
jgi:hypothetical protein